jgi:hypothetical protein
MIDPSLPSRPAVRRALLILAAVGFMLAAAVHLAAVLGLDLTGGRTAPFVALHVGIFPLFFAALLALGGELRGVPTAEKPKRILGLVPRGWRYLVAALFYYAAANFVLFMLASGGGSPHQHGDAYHLVRHGRVVRALTREEYEAAKVWVVRGFSGHWLVFYLVPLLVFGVVRRRGDTAGASPPSAASRSGRA